MFAGRYDELVDEYGVGLVIYYLLSAFGPFAASTSAEIKSRNKFGVISFDHEQCSRISSEARSLVLRLTQNDPKLRLTAKEALNHPWFVKMRVIPEEKSQERSCWCMSMSFSTQLLRRNVARNTLHEYYVPLPLRPPVVPTKYEELKANKSEDRWCKIQLKKNP